MKVLDLQCRAGHVFEGWFDSESDYQSQLGRGLVSCPLCGDTHVDKRLSAPRLNLSTARSEPHSAMPDGAPPPSTRIEHPDIPAMQAAWLRAARAVIAQTEDVGDRFADEARRMHHGDVPERPIRGAASPDEAVRLLEEGVPIMPLVMPPAAKETLQ